MSTDMYTVVAYSRSWWNRIVEI